MKKVVLSLFLILLLTVCAACAFADEAVVVDDPEIGLTVTMTPPEGYEMLSNEENGHLYIDLISAQEENVVYSIVVGHSEEYAGQTMMDMTEEEIAHIVGLISLDFAAPQVAPMEVEGRTVLFSVLETGSESGYACVVTVYNGYFVTVHMHRADYAALTEADVQAAVDLLSGMQFTVRQ